MMDMPIAVEGWGEKRGHHPWLPLPQHWVQPYFLISLTSILIDVSAWQPSAVAVYAPGEEESISLLENPEDLPSNEMLSRSSEPSCQKKAAWQRQSPATCTKHEADSNLNSSYAYYIPRSAEADNWEMPPLTHYILSRRYLIYFGMWRQMLTTVINSHN